MTAPRAQSGDPFEHLLARLAPTRDEAGRTYEHLRRRLIRVFEGRRAFDPEAAADETLDRLARRLAQGVVVDDPAAYVLGIARLVALERERRVRRIVPLPADPVAPALPADEERTARATCLEQCLSSVDPQARDAVVEYYTGDDGRGRIDVRRRMAVRMGVTPVALRLRMFRIRLGLEDCVRGCLERRRPRPRNRAGGGDTPMGKGHEV
jgi:DNA-directed RNA polymerase specialized sigma24 family protein